MLALLARRPFLSTDANCVVLLAAPPGRLQPRLTPMVVRPFCAFLAALAVTSSAFPAASIAQGGRTGGEAPQGGGRGSWDVTLARGKTRDIDFTTNVGTLT